MFSSHKINKAKYRDGRIAASISTSSRLHWQPRGHAYCVPLTCKITVPIRIFWGYETEKRVEEHVLNSVAPQPFLTKLIIHRATIVTFGHNCICMPWYYCLIWFFFLFNREKNPAFLKSVFLKEVMCLSQDRTLLLHFKKLQKVYRSYTSSPFSQVQT